MALQSCYAPLLMALSAGPLAAQGGSARPLSAVAKYAQMIRAVADTAFSEFRDTERKWPYDKLGAMPGIGDSASMAYMRLESEFKQIADDLAARVAPPDLVKVHDQFVAVIRLHVTLAQAEKTLARWCERSDRRCTDMDSLYDVSLAQSDALLARIRVGRRIEAMMVEAGAPPNPKNP